MPINTDVTTPVGKVRLLITDVVDGVELFSDAEIQAFLDLFSGSVFRAAAQAADTIAISEVLTSKKIKSQDLATDGPAVAESMRKLAASLRERAGEIDADGEIFTGYFVAPEEEPARW